MQCPKCSAEVTAPNKFCGECGTPMPKPKKGSTGKVEIGEKAIVSGEVVGGDKTEIKTHGGDAHVHHHKTIDETKSVSSCIVCGRNVEKTKSYTCKECGEPVCEDHYQRQVKACDSCAENRQKSNQQIYNAELDEVYADSVVESEERAKLEVLARRLNIKPERARMLEEQVKRKGFDSGGISSLDKRKLRNAEKALTNQNDTDTACEELGSLYERHVSGVQSVLDKDIQKIRRLYLIAMVDKDPDLAERKIADCKYDDRDVLLSKIDLSCLKGKIYDAENQCSEFRIKFPDDPNISPKIAEVLLERYRIEKKQYILEEFMEEFKRIYDDEIPDEGTRYKQFLFKYYQLLKDEPHDELQGDDIYSFFYHSRKKRLEAGDFNLYEGDKRHPCRPGDIIGREGDVAKSYFKQIKTVSRKHVRIDMQKGKWGVIKLPDAVNLTKIDGKEMTREEFNPLDNGEHWLTISTLCKIRISVGQQTEKRGESA